MVANASSIFWRSVAGSWPRDINITPRGQRLHIHSVTQAPPSRSTTAHTQRDTSVTLTLSDCAYTARHKRHPHAQRLRIHSVTQGPLSRSAAAHTQRDTS
eukprot:1190392-Prorocentrum_minimum.AAC.6